MHFWTFKYNRVFVTPKIVLAKVIMLRKIEGINEREVDER